MKTTDMKIYRALVALADVVLDLSSLAPNYSKETGKKLQEALNLIGEIVPDSKEKK